MNKKLVRFAMFAALSPALLLAVPAPSASADVVRLKSGETVVGRLLFDRTNEQVLVIEDYVTGGVREIAWEVVNPIDREKMENVGGLNLGTEKEMFIKCETLTLRQLNGTTSVRGVVEKEEGDYLLVRTGATREPIRIEKARIISREESECAPDDIYTSEELYEKLKTEIAPQDARGHFRLARRAELVGAYVGAKESYEIAASDEAFLQRALAQAGAARCAAIIKDTEALDTLRTLRNWLSNTEFARVRSGMDEFGTKHPQASDGVKKQLETLRTRFAEKRTVYFCAEAGRRFVEILKQQIHAKVAPKDAAYNDVQAWARKEAIDKSFEELTLKFQVKDAAVTAEETKGFFDARPKKASGWKLAKYGAGSFLIEPPTIKPPTGGNKPAPSGKSGKNQGPAVQIEIPPPPTRDGWWAKANADERTQFWLAAIVEKSGIFDVAPKRERANCALCLGEGLISKVLSNATQLTYLCPRCGGARYDLSVKFR